MEKRSKHVAIVAFLVQTVLALLILVPTTQALSFNTSDLSLNYLIVSGAPDIVTPGATVVVSVTGKLPENSSTQDIFRISLFVDTASEPGKVVGEGDLLLPNDGTPGNATFSVAIPANAIVDTYLYMSLNDNFRSYSKISISLIQSLSYPELKLEVQKLQAENSTITILMYIAIFVAAVFIVSTVYIIAITFKANKRQRTKLAVPIRPQDQG